MERSEADNKWDDNKYSETFFGHGSSPMVRCVVYGSSLHRMGDVKGKSCLDIACGEGDFCRLLKSKGAAKVVGLDLCEAMIQSARAEKWSSFDCEYKIGDAIKLGKIDEFDFVTAHRFLTYADTYDVLIGMCKSFYANLKPGGRFVGLALNCKYDGDYGDTSKYLMNFERLAPVGEAKRFRSSGSEPNEAGVLFSSVIHYFEPQVYERAFKEVGFRKFSLEKSIVDESLCHKLPSGFWDLYLSQPQHLCYVADK